jgi:glycosyltransferase involved in cell wall biosynthesis
MLVQNDIIDDPRVTKEAKALSELYRVTVLGLYQDRDIPFECDGYKLKPIYVRMRKVGGSSLQYFLALCEWTIRAITKSLRLKPKVIHAHDLPALPAAYITGKLRRAKVVYDAHELYTETGGYSRITIFFWRALERFLLKRVDLTITVNESRAQIMYQEYHAPRVPVVIMNLPEFKNNLKTSKRFREKCFESGLNKDCSFIVLYQGNIGAGRDLDFVIKSVEKWPSAVGLVLMGEAEEWLKKLPKQLNLENRVIFYPKVAMTDLISLASQADMGLVTYATDTRNNYYCAPNKLFEYAAAGIPILGVDLPEIKKYITKYDCGLLFKPRDYNSIAKAVELAVNSLDLRQKFRQGAKKMISELNWETEKDKLLKLYAELLSK